jgi:hypothetical protein
MEYLIIGWWKAHTGIDIADGCVGQRSMNTIREQLGIRHSSESGRNRNGDG